MDEKLRPIFEEWLEKQPNTWMLSEPVKKLMFKAFLFGMSQPKGDR